MPFISSYFPSGKNGILPNREIRMILTRIKKVRQMGSIHPTDFIIYDFNKKRLQFEGLFQWSLSITSLFYATNLCLEKHHFLQEGQEFPS